MKKLILFLLIAPSLAHAANWVKVGSAPGSDFYMDKNSVIKSGPGLKVWSLVNHAKEQTTPDGKPFMSVKALHVYSCEERTTSLISEVYYSEAMGKGALIQRVKYEKFDAEDIVPDTATDVTLNVVCKKPAPEAKPSASAKAPDAAKPAPAPAK